MLIDAEQCESQFNLKVLSLSTSRSDGQLNK